MGTTTRTSGKAVASFLAGVLSLACGVFALTTESDLFLAGIVLFLALAVGLGCWAWIEDGRSSGMLTGRSLAGWGIALPVVGCGLGFLLLPQV
jgi:hypothetical protein